MGQVMTFAEITCSRIREIAAFSWMSPQAKGPKCRRRTGSQFPAPLTPNVRHVEGCPPTNPKVLELIQGTLQRGTSTFFGDPTWRWGFHGLKSSCCFRIFADMARLDPPLHRFFNHPVNPPSVYTLSLHAIYASDGSMLGALEIRIGFRGEGGGGIVAANYFGTMRVPTPIGHGLCQLLTNPQQNWEYYQQLLRPLYLYTPGQLKTASAFKTTGYLGRVQGNVKSWVQAP